MTSKKTSVPWDEFSEPARSRAVAPQVQVDVPGKPLASRRKERGAMELVRPAARDRVHQHAAKIALLHIERREQHLVLPNRLEPDRFPARLSPRLPRVAEPTRLLSISYAVFCLKKKSDRQL